MWPNPSSEDGCFRLYPFQWAWWRDETERSVDQCVAEGQLVLTERGHIPIEDVMVGDRVLTHNGRWRRVNEVFDRGEQDVVRVKGQGHPGLLVTPDHPLYARRSRRASKPKDGHTGKKLLEPEWLAPEDWEWNDGSGAMTANWGAPAVIEALPLPDQMVPIRDTGRQNYVLDCWTESWMWLYGCFIAEGSTYFDAPDKGRVKRSCWSLHIDEVDVITGHLDKVGLNHSVERKGNVGVVSVNSGPVAWWLKQHAGHLAHNKRLAPWVFGLPEILRRKVFEGATFGDAWARTGWTKQRQDGSPLERPLNRSSYSTVSRELAVGIRMLALTLGASASVSRSAPSTSSFIDGRRIIGRHDRYAIETEPLADQERGHVKIVDGTAWAAVRSIEPAGRARVYDLGVEEDHSFVVEGVIVRNCSRDVGKSERICARSCAHPFVNPGEEHALVAPEGSHIDRLTGRIEQRIKSVWLLLEMVTGGMRGITHQPFEIAWRNGAQTYSRLPQRSGIGVKGVHAVWLDVDEAQDISDRTWSEMGLTVRWDIPGGRWCAHGVSKGVHDEFWRKTQPNSGWKVYRFTQLHKPTFDSSPESWAQLIKDNGGSEESGDFKRNVFGEHGDIQNRIFVLTHFMSGVDTRAETSDSEITVNQDYYQPTIMGDEIAANVGSKVAVEISSEEASNAVINMLDFPMTHVNRYTTFWAGMDVGLVGDPSEICVCAEYVPSKRELEMHKRGEIAVPEEGISRLRLLTRIRVLRLPEPLQADLIMWLIDFYRPKAFALDAGGNGFPLFQELQKRAGKSRIMAVEPTQPDAGATADERDAYAAALEEFNKQRHPKSEEAVQALTVIKGYKFGSKLVVDFDEEKVAELGANPSMKDMIEKAAIFQEAKTRATDVLRTFVDNRRFLFPDDSEFVDQMNGQTFTFSAEPIDAYGKRRAVYSAGNFHILDAMRFLALGYSQDQIEKLLKKAEEPPAPVIARFVGL